MRSCSLSVVLVEEPAEQVASVDPGRLSVAGEGQSDGWIRRLQPERPVRVGCINAFAQVIGPDIAPTQRGLEVLEPRARVGPRAGGSTT